MCESEELVHFVRDPKTFSEMKNKIFPFSDFLHAISTQRVQLTNPSCLIKTEVVCNREKPTVTFLLTPTVQGKNYTSKLIQVVSFSFLEATKLKSVKIEADNLTYLELLRVTNEQVTARAPKEEPVKTLKTKSEKKSASGAKRR